jgi:tRNA U55 pseudouridine synthase TruB
VGEDLGCGACITEIRRTQVGPFSINEAVKLDDVNETHIHPWHPPA